MTATAITALANGSGRMLFDEYRANRAERVIHVHELSPRANLWFIGDLHGDLLALETALRYIGDDGARIVFLGDLFDDGAHGAEVVDRVAKLILDRPGRVCVLAGNHDEGLRWTEGRFSSSVDPCEFADWLNEHRAEELGRAVIRFFETAPRALFLPDGLLVTHGGFPLKDRWEQIHGLPDLNTPECLQDFVWTRASESAPMKIPNRSSKGCQFGYADFAGFCELATRVLGTPVARMLRGHDHVADRYLFYERYKECPALTINTLSHRLYREMLGPYARTPCVARWVWGTLPEVHRLQIPEETLREMYPEPKNQ